MYNKVLETIEKYNMLSKGGNVVAGLSGGADSSAMVHILAALRDKFDIKITAVHINHGIRGDEAYRDEEISRKFCEGLGIDFLVYHCDIPAEAKKRGMGEEETGRLVRYEKFRETAEKLGSAKIAVAHNTNDMAETLLMHLCRGAGLNGLAGIKPVNNGIIRPLLFCTRAEIEHYCDTNNIAYCTDSTNLKTDYTRNKVRRILLPWLESEINTSAGANIASTAVLLREDENYLEELAEEKYAEYVLRSEADRVELKDSLSAEKPVMRKRILRIALKTCRANLKDYSRKHIEGTDDILMGETGRKIDLPGGICAEKGYGCIKIIRKSESKAGKLKDMCYVLNINEEKYIPEIGKRILLSLNDEKKFSNDTKVYTKKADYDKINSEPIEIRTRRAGDRINIGKGSKKLKDYMIDEKIPSEKRNSIPLLACGGRVIAIGGRLGMDFYITEKTKNILYIYMWEEARNEGKS